MDFTWLAASGVLTGIIIFALKVSLGCGLASLSRRDTLTVATAYLVISLIVGIIIELVPEDALTTVMNLGVATHLIIAFLLVIVGVITAREWNWHGNDISRKTFWVLSVPCPACMAAIFLSCSILFGLLDVASWKIGAAVGLIFFIAITVFSTTVGRIGRAPATLGNVMIFVGLFYILSILVIPAYLKSQTIPFVSEAMPASDLVTSYLFILSLVALGFVSSRWGVSF
ncbi:MAG: DUF2162 domain-containing protein [Methanotrichaceae archaeon]